MRVGVIRRTVRAWRRVSDGCWHTVGQFVPEALLLDEVCVRSLHFRVDSVVEHPTYTGTLAVAVQYRGVYVVCLPRQTFNVRKLPGKWGSQLHLAFCPVTHRLLVSDYDRCTIQVINPDLDTRAETWELASLSGLPSQCTWPHYIVGMLVTQQGYVLLADIDNHVILELNGAGTLCRVLFHPKWRNWMPNRMALTSDGHRLLVQGFESDRLDVFDLATWTLLHVWHSCYIGVPFSVAGDCIVVYDRSASGFRWLRWRDGLSMKLQRSGLLSEWIRTEQTSVPHAQLLLRNQQFLVVCDLAMHVFARCLP